MSKIVQMWDNADQTIVRMAFKNWWTVDDYYIAFEQFCDMAYQQEHVVHCLADFTNSEGFLGHLLKDTPQLEASMPPNYGLCVIVGASYQVETMFSIAYRVAPRVFGNVSFAATLPEGRECIYQAYYQRYAPAE